MKKFIYTLVSIVIVLFISGRYLGSIVKGSDTNNLLQKRIACSGIFCDIVDFGAGVMAEHGIRTERVFMDNAVNILHAVNDGSVDAALGVHEKFLAYFNEKNNANLVMVKPYPFTTGIGLYSEKYHTLADFPVGAKIAIMNDAMNMDRALTMLQQAGLIILDANKKSNYSLLDIIANPRKITFIDVDQTQTVSALPDLDGAVAFFTHIYNAGKQVNSYIIRDKDAQQFPIGFVVNSQNAKQQWAKFLADSLRTKSVQESVQNNFNGVFDYY
ncbi:MetQ/NlpA family ABC transporter substrate-binding protein [Arsenophonus sp. aPb]|uniref:MetQ/NlpA family ABC transporter substrate-binding protein n=1 Tax=Arsenophonus sp. aPb TaxID=3041619 RepID=UPI0024686576|nr:MetQ/NlpA family ABC transporter substrate-binding protein [Arsenophonus sp. aPb]WGL98692.1 MetQ/NlpA family ABC transporter substrate-binding protein [Arsenophonus sp. aPb]